MIFRFLLSFFLCFISLSAVWAQGIRGRITDSGGEPVPFANIYVPQLSTGTTSNIEGDYELKLSEGNWKIIFQYIGYQTVAFDLTIGKTFQKKNVQLIIQNYKIPQITILASGEDPAYYIMRRAIALAPYYQKQVSKYSCKVYLKGSGVFEEIPSMAKLLMDKKKLMDLKEPFVLETVSKIDFELPDKIKQEVLAMHSSGKDNNTSPMGMITNNLYDADKYGVVSPVGINALRVYRFSLESVFEDQGFTINKIKVTPKTNGNDVFSGYIYIADLYWNIHSADLKLHIPMTDVDVHQLYAQVNKNTWMPVSLDFDMNFEGLGFKMKFRYVATIANYITTLNPALDHTFLDKLNKEQTEDLKLLEKMNVGKSTIQKNVEPKTKVQKQIDQLMEKSSLSNRETIKLNRMIKTETKRNSPPEPLEIKSTFKVSSKQVNNDSAYWAGLRPIPLTETEKISFVKKDSFLIISSKPQYQDSVLNFKRKFKFKHLLLGKNYDYSIDSIRLYQRLSIPNLLNPTSLSFNSVDGLKMELPFSYFKSDSTGHMKRIGTTFGYGFARTKPDISFLYEQRLNGMRNSWFSFGAGTLTSDYNRTSPLSSITNTLYTLFLEQNFKRYYERNYLQLGIGRDLVNGLNLKASVEYSDNSPLTNHSNFSFIDYSGREILPNIPLNNALIPWQLENHQSLIGQIALEFTPHHRYSIHNNSKVYAESKYPTFSLVYTGAYSGIFGSTARYDLLKLGIGQKIRFGIDDHLSYILNAGSFLNSSKVYFEDFQHFNAQSTGFTFNSTENSFRLLPFYEFSTQKSFVDVHINYLSRRIILKHLPIIKNSSVSESLFMNLLSTPGMKNYLEAGYGLHQLFLLLNIEAVAGFENGKFRSTGVRVSINLK